MYLEDKIKTIISFDGRVKEEQRLRFLPSMENKKYGFDVLNYCSLQSYFIYPPIEIL